MPLPLTAPTLKICGLDPTKQALLDAIANKKATLLNSLKNKTTALTDMAAAKNKGVADSLINKLVANIPLIPSIYKADIAALLKKMIGPPVLTSGEIQTEVNNLVTKWGQDKLNELTTLTQNFIDGQTPELCSIVNLEKVGSAVPVLKPLESFPATGSADIIENVVSTVEDKSAAPNTDRVASTVVAKNVKSAYRTTIETPREKTILNVITDFYATNSANFSNTQLADGQRWSLLYLDSYNLNLKRKVGGVDIGMIRARMKTLNIQYYVDFYNSGKASDAEIKFLTEMFLADNTKEFSRQIWGFLLVFSSLVEKKFLGFITTEEYNKGYTDSITDLLAFLKQFNGAADISKVDFTFTNEDVLKITYKTTSTQFSVSGIIKKLEDLYSPNVQLIKDYYAVKDNK